MNELEEFALFGGEHRCGPRFRFHWNERGTCIEALEPWSSAQREEAAEQAWPCSEPMLSGWNWMPCSGASAWRTAIARPSALQALATSGGADRGRRASGSASPQRRGQAGEQAAAVMGDLVDLAMDWRNTIDLEPQATAIAWWPRQTPSSGRLTSTQAAARSTEIPACSGVPGPGEIRKPSYGAGSASGTRDRIVPLDRAPCAERSANNRPG